MSVTKISVIIPVYKVSEFIERCAKSLMCQTLSDIEYIFVDDATPDDSIQKLKGVLSMYPEKKEKIRIIHHSQNKGLPAARNTGLQIASGKYIFHCDSDDYVEPDMLEKLYVIAEDNEVDIVWCDWFLTFAKNERYMKQPRYDTPLDALKGMLSGKMKFNVWNKLVRHSLYMEHNVRFPEGYGMGEDMTMIMLFAFAQKVQYTPYAYYHYVKLNTNAFSNTYSYQNLCELKHNIRTIEEFIHNIYGDSLEKEIGLFKLEAKFPFLMTDNQEKYRLWGNWYPESNKYINSKRDVGFRRLFLEKCAQKHQYWVLWIYNKFIHRVIYGIIYK